MTVREALTFAAALRLPAAMPAAAKEQRALDVAELLSLTKSLDNVVGSSMLKGISGGEKRRLSLGMEMVSENVDVPLHAILSVIRRSTRRALSWVTIGLEHSASLRCECQIEPNDLCRHQQTE